MQLVWLQLLLLPRALATTVDGVCLAGGECAENFQVPKEARGPEDRPTMPLSPEDKPCREVLEVLQVGEPDVWKRKKPASIAGVVENAKWDKGAFSRERLLSDFGAVRVKAFSPAQAALLGGQTSRRHPVRQILSRMRDPLQLLYVFDKDFFNNPKAKRIARIPKWLAMSSADQLLTLGGPRSGAHFHAHGPAFLTLLAGHKRWYFHQPGKFPNSSVPLLEHEVSAWEEEVLPKLGSEAPIRCVQEPGETIFVPDSWAHATTNLDDTVGVAWQRFTTGIRTCDLGSDYMCLLQHFSSAAVLNPKQQALRWPKLFGEAEGLTGGFAAGFLRFLGPFWKVSSEAKDVFKRQLAHVKEMLKAAKPSTDRAILGAALTKALVDALFTAHPKRADKAAALLQMATRKAPEAGLCVAHAQLLGQQGKWREAAEQLERHLVHFPDDTDASTMMGQARERAKR